MAPAGKIFDVEFCQTNPWTSVYCWDENFEFQAPQWIDFNNLDSLEASDDEAWFCKPECNHGKSISSSRSASKSRKRISNASYQGQSPASVKSLYKPTSVRTKTLGDVTQDYVPQNNRKNILVAALLNSQSNTEYGKTVPRKERNPPLTINSKPVKKAPRSNFASENQNPNLASFRNPNAKSVRTHSQRKYNIPKQDTLDVKAVERNTDFANSHILPEKSDVSEQTPPIAASYSADDENSNKPVGNFTPCSTKEGISEITEVFDDKASFSQVSAYTFQKTPRKPRVASPSVTSLDTVIVTPRKPIVASPSVTSLDTVIVKDIDEEDDRSTFSAFLRSRSVYASRDDSEMADYVSDLKHSSSARHMFFRTTSRRCLKKVSSICSTMKHVLHCKKGKAVKVDNSIMPKGGSNSAWKEQGICAHDELEKLDEEEFHDIIDNEQERRQMDLTKKSKFDGKFRSNRWMKLKNNAKEQNWNDNDSTEGAPHTERILLQCLEEEVEEEEEYQPKETHKKFNFASIFKPRKWTK